VGLASCTASKSFRSAFFSGKKIVRCCPFVPLPEKARCVPGPVDRPERQSAMIQDHRALASHQNNLK